MRARVTMRQAVILGGVEPCVGGMPPAVPILRELMRFGVERATLLGPIPDPAAQDDVLHSVDELARRVEIEFAAAPPAIQEDGFLLVSGTRLFDANVAHLLAAFAADPPGTLGRLALLPGAGPADFAGIAALDARLLPALSAADFLPRLFSDPHIRSGVLPGWFHDLSDPAHLASALHEAEAVARRPALFLDRDGVLNHDHAYVGSRERWEWVSGAREAVRFAADHGWHVFIVTNQSGIARGYYTEAEATALHDWVIDEIRRAGGTIDDIRICPYLPDAPVATYARDSDWRKPKPGMLLHLIRAWGLDPAHCVMVGDRASDAEAAAAAGMACHLFGGGDLLAFLEPILMRTGVAKSPARANIA